MLTSIDVKSVFESERLGLFSFANTLQLTASCFSCHVFSFFLPSYYSCNEFMSAIFVHNQNNSTSSPGLLG